jgi:hypothetical protein
MKSLPPQRETLPPLGHVYELHVHTCSLIHPTSAIGSQFAHTDCGTHSTHAARDEFRSNDSTHDTRVRSAGLAWRSRSAAALSRRVSGVRGGAMRQWRMGWSVRLPSYIAYSTRHMNMSVQMWSRVIERSFRLTLCFVIYTIRSMYRSCNRRDAPRPRPRPSRACVPSRATSARLAAARVRSAPHGAERGRRPGHGRSLALPSLRSRATVRAHRAASSHSINRRGP